MFKKYTIIALGILVIGGQASGMGYLRRFSPFIVGATTGAMTCTHAARTETPKSEYRDIFDVISRCHSIQNSEYEKKCGSEIAKFRKIINQRDGFSTPLSDAAFKGNSNAAESLLRHGADINKTDGGGSTALHQAVHAGKEYVVGLLIANKADTTIKNQSGKTAVDIAQEKIQLYKREGYDPDDLSRASRILDLLKKEER